jgi:hypothetical protein
MACKSDVLYRFDLELSEHDKKTGKTTKAYCVHLDSLL